MDHASKRRLGRGSARRQAVLIMLLVICSVAVARVLSPAAEGWPRSLLWDRPHIVGEVEAVESDTETELCPPMAETQSKGAAQPPISHTG